VNHTALLVVSLLSLSACQEKPSGSQPTPTPSAVPTTTAASSAAASAAPSVAPKPSAEPKPVVPIPAIDEKLPVEKLDLAAFLKEKKANKDKLVGKKVRVRGIAHSISKLAMVFDAAKHGLHGPEGEDVPGGVYGVEIRGNTSEESVSCFLDAKSAKEVEAAYAPPKKLELEVEGIVEPTFGQLAPCRVVSKKVEK